MGAKKNPSARIYNYPRKADQPRFEGSLPSCPKGVSRHAFAAIVAELSARRTVTKGDQDAIALLCILKTRHRKALAAIVTEGELVDVTRSTSKGELYSTRVRNEWLDIAQETERQILACLTALTLTPATRDKAKITTPAEETTKGIGATNPALLAAIRGGAAEREKYAKQNTPQDVEIPIDEEEPEK